jgi:signal transduction histidine kinase
MAIAAAIQIGGTAGASGHRGAPGQHGCWWATSCRAPTHMNALGIVLLAAGPLLLALRRQRPREVLAGVFGITVLYVALGYLQGPNYASLVIAFVGAVKDGERLTARIVLGASWVLFLWLPAILGVTGAPTALAALAITAWMLVLLAGAEGMRSRRERAAEARRARQQEARRQADEERLRIARELHDVLAHNISLINVRSGVALHLMDEQPEQARSALEAIHEASADALREVRSALDVLRGGGEQAPRSPTAGLARLDELVSSAGATGLEVSLHVHGEPHPLPATVDLAAFRIVQESLTNVVRHAGPGTAAVRLEYAADELRIEVTDTGRGAGAERSFAEGQGVTGMRTRADAVGGTLEAGPRPGGGFSVRARLPVAGS